MALISRPCLSILIVEICRVIGVDETAITSIEFMTAFGDISLRTPQGLGEEHRKRASGIPWIKGSTIINGFLNLQISDTISGYWRPSLPLSGKTACIEHTSMTPVYPINLATARSSIIGEQLRRVSCALGARSYSSYWVEEKARQISAVQLPHNLQLRAYGKPDHVIGRVFQDAVCGRDLGLFLGDPGREHMTARHISHTTRGRIPSREQVSEVIYGHQWSLSEIGILFDVVHYEDDILSSFNWWQYMAELSELGLLSKEWDLLQPRPNERPRYVVRSTIYSHFLSMSYDLVWSVVPARQYAWLVPAFRAAAASVPAEKVFSEIYYADTLVNGKPDSVREHRFHPLDAYLRAPGAADHLRLSVLSVRPGSAVEITRDTVAPSHRERMPEQHLTANLIAVLLIEEFYILAMKFLESGSYSNLLAWESEARQLIRNIPYLSGSLIELARILTILVG